MTMLSANDDVREVVAEPNDLDAIDELDALDAIDDDVEPQVADAGVDELMRVFLARGAGDHGAACNQDLFLAKPQDS